MAAPAPDRFGWCPFATRGVVASFFLPVPPESFPNHPNHERGQRKIVSPLCLAGGMRALSRLFLQYHARILPTSSFRSNCLSWGRFGLYNPAGGGPANA